MYLSACQAVTPETLRADHSKLQGYVIAFVVVQLHYTVNLPSSDCWQATDNQSNKLAPVIDSSHAWQLSDRTH